MESRNVTRRNTHYLITNKNQKRMAEKKETEGKKLFIDSDAAIKLHNDKNPDDKITRKILAERLGCTYQSLTNYQGGKIPDAVGMIDNIMNITGIAFCDLIKTQEK